MHFIDLSDIDVSVKCISVHMHKGSHAVAQPGQTTPGHCMRLSFFVVVVVFFWLGGLGASSPSKFLHLRGSYSNCS